MRKIFLPALAATVLFASCKKDDDNNNCERTISGIAGSYKISGFQYKQTPNSTPIDALIFLDACQKDDVLKLNTNGTYNSIDAGTACSPDGSFSGTWNVTGNYLVQDGTDSASIKSYDCNALVLTYTGYNTPGDEATLTLVKQ